MNRKLPTILILMVMVIMGVIFWLDLVYYTDPQTGFLVRGSMWMRYALFAVPLIMSLFGMKTVGAHSVGVLRRRSPGLASAFVLAGLSGLVYGFTLIFTSIKPLSIFSLISGPLFLWYGVWMLLAALQLFVQSSPSPTISALWGVIGALPFCLMAISRVLINPTSLYRIGPAMRCFSALFIVLWMGTMLRAFYIALTRKRVCWLYGFGIFTFFMATCLELPFAIYNLMLGNLVFKEFMEAICMALAGIAAGCMSVYIGGSPEAKVNAGLIEN